MKKLCIPLVLLWIFIGLGTPANAKPEKGIAVFGGSAQHTSKVAGPGFFPIEFDSSGLSLGIDGQIPLSDSISLNPILMLTGESVTGDITGSASHTILGASIRFWLGGLFVGPHAGLYSESVTIDAAGGAPGGDVSSSGIGVGFALGWEHESGFLVMFQYDTASLTDDADPDTDVDVTGTRLQAGYRWNFGKKEE